VVSGGNEFPSQYMEVVSTGSTHRLRTGADDGAQVVTQRMGNGCTDDGARVEGRFRQAQPKASGWGWVKRKDEG